MITQPICRDGISIDDKRLDALLLANGTSKF